MASACALVSARTIAVQSLRVTKEKDTSQNFSALGSVFCSVFTSWLLGLKSRPGSRGRSLVQTCERPRVYHESAPLQAEKFPRSPLQPGYDPESGEVGKLACDSSGSCCDSSNFSERVNRESQENLSFCKCLKTKGLEQRRGPHCSFYNGVVAPALSRGRARDFPQLPTIRC